MATSVKEPHTTCSRKSSLIFSRLTETSIVMHENYNNFYFYFTAGKNGENDQKNNLLKGYSINDFNGVEVSFENQLKTGMKGKNLLKIIDKKDIIGDIALKYSNTIEIKNPVYKINLIFDDNKLFSSMYVLKKE
ncbi:hypothetical protein [Pedobacter foliorum]|uniref:hypothetical protein n=1 Tax=Pedobacter foliorum TaxID=2739058 RepID=UPI0015639FEE|nr:hypothetical protein [Pedobacter foliorum]NRF37429.1 hypothetical protein [Pedobacter foliorum]